MSTKPTIGGTNRLGVRFVTKGAPGLRSKLNEIIRCFDYLFPCPTADIISEVTPQGTLHRLRTPAGLTSTRTAIHPFQVFPVAGAAKVRVAYGTVTGGGANLIPTIGGTSIATTPAPELTVVTGTVYIKATVDAAGVPTASVIENAATTPADTATEKHRTITSVTVSGTTVTVVSPQSVQTALNLFICGGTAIWERA